MPHYFFDSWDEDELARDDVGLDLPDLHSAKVAAAKALAELAHDVLPGDSVRRMKIEVRDDQGAIVMTTKLSFHSSPEE